MKTVEEYLRLPYTIELVPEPEGGWFVAVKELPGCMSTGDSPDEAIDMIRDAMRVWIEAAQADGQPIPEPRLDEEYSGKFVVRVPRSLHRQLVETADREGVSLNQYINVALGRAVGRASVTASAPVPGVSGWPGLSEAVRGALQAAGMQAEAGQVDERLFADWLGRQLAEVEKDYAGGFVKDALRGLDRLREQLRLHIGRSPVLGMFSRLLDFAHAGVAESARAQPDLRSTTQAWSLAVSQIIQQTYQPGARQLMAEERAQYSRTATRPERALADELFNMSGESRVDPRRKLVNDW